MITLQDVRQARELIGADLHRTPMTGTATLSRMAGRPVLLKLENLQKTGSFKPRGALNNIRRLDRPALEAGVITISAGNHAQGTAFAAALAGTHAVVVMPETASRTKAEACRDYGAEVILHGDVTQAFRKLEEVRLERGLTFIHPFDDDATIAGQGTVGLEIVEDASEVGTVLVGIGGGGLISGVAVAVLESNPRARVIGVEPSGAAVMRQSLRQGSPARLDRANTIADGLAAPFAGVRNYEIVSHYVEDVVLVEDDEIRSAMRLLLERCKILAEPAGAAAAAALLAGRIPSGADSGPTVVVVSGGNIAMETLGELLAR
ncbi:MAG TPA: threonine/serine dehydratase [Candidatus Polarisedimenticolia bacterium]|nr:threonine/serine dehydratase [Candidatus Polarisedimenticolia bacterium]